MFMSKELLRTGDKATVRFRFIKNPEYLRTDMRMVFREGRTKAVGNVTKLFPHISLTAQNTRQQRATKKAVDSNHHARPQNEPQKPSKKNRRSRNRPYPPSGGAAAGVAGSCSSTALGGSTSNESVENKPAAAAAQS